MKPMPTTKEVLEQAIESCIAKGWDWVSFDTPYTALIMAWFKGPDTNWYREMLIVDGVGQAESIPTKNGKHPENNPEVVEKLETFQLNMMQHIETDN
jgi:hypothetical protein